jgi:hypothetical protein
MSLICKSNFTGTECRIFRGKLIAGILKTSSWNEEGYGELDGNMLRFRSQGFWKKTIDITDIEGQKVLGQMQFRYLKGTATITYSGQNFKWQFDSWTMRNWTVKNEEGSAGFKSTSWWKPDGELANEGVPAAVLLASLYVANHFRKIAAAS